MILQVTESPEARVRQWLARPQLAALAIEHQGEVHSNDADFARFPALRWPNPLA